MNGVFQFASASSWVVDHDLGYYPVTEVIVLHEGQYEKILPADVVMNSVNQLTITFTSPREGYVRVS